MKLLLQIRKIKPEHIGGLYVTPAYPSDYEHLQRFKKDEMFQAEVTKPRNVKHNAKYRAILRFVVANSEKWNSPDDLHTALKYSLGVCDIIEGFNGMRYFKEHSTSFEKMSQDKFAEYYRNAIQLLVQETGLSEYEIEDGHYDYL